MIENNLTNALKTWLTGSRDTIRKAAVNAILDPQKNCVETRILLESELKELFKIMGKMPKVSK